MTEMTQNWLTTLPNCFLLLLRPPMWRVQSVGRCCGYRNVCDPVSRRKRTEHLFNTWRICLKVLDIWITSRLKAAFWAFGGLFAGLPSLVSGMGGLDGSCGWEMSFSSLLLSPLQASRCSATHSLVLFFFVLFFDGDGQTNSADTSSGRGFGKPWW